MNHKVSRLLTILACVGVLSLFTAAATPSYCPVGATSLSVYLAPGFSCQIGDKIFSSFSYSPSGTNPVPYTSVTVEGVGPTGTAGATFQDQFTALAADIGFQFSAPWSAPSGGTTTDATIGFNVTIVAGGAQEIEDAAVVQTGGITGNGTAVVNEAGCSAPNAPGQICSAFWGVDTDPNTFAADTIFAPTGSIGVSKDILVAANNGTANITAVQDVFSQTAVPEPRAISLFLGLGLIAGLTFKKLQGARS